MAITFDPNRAAPGVNPADNATPAPDAGEPTKAQKKGEADSLTKGGVTKAEVKVAPPTITDPAQRAQLMERVSAANAVAAQAPAAPLGQLGAFSFDDLLGADVHPQSLIHESIAEIAAQQSAVTSGDLLLGGDEQAALARAHLLVKSGLVARTMKQTLTAEQKQAVTALAKAISARHAPTASALSALNEQVKAAIVAQMPLMNRAQKKAAAVKAKAKLPLAVQKAFAKAMPHLLSVIRATLGSPLLPPRKAGAPPAAHEDLEIPDSDMVKLEQAFAGPLGEAKSAMAASNPETAASQAATPAPQAIIGTKAVMAPMLTGDIDAIVEMVMMEAAQEGEDELEDRATYQEQLNQKTEALRNTQAAQQTAEANAKQALQDEYNRRCALPPTDPEYINSTNVTFADYSGSQTVVQTPPMTFDADGLPTNNPTYVLSPNVTYYPNTPAGLSTDGGATIPQALVDQATQLNVSPQTLYGLEQRYNNDPALNGPYTSFAEFCVAAVGLSAGSANPQDATIEAWMSTNQPAPTKGSGQTQIGSSSALTPVQQLAQTYNLSQADAQAISDYWNSLPADYQSLFPAGSDASVLLTTSVADGGAGIASADDPDTTHAKIVAFFNSEKTRTFNIVAGNDTLTANDITELTTIQPSGPGNPTCQTGYDANEQSAANDLAALFASLSLPDNVRKELGQDMDNIATCLLAMATPDNAKGYEDSVRSALSSAVSKLTADLNAIPDVAVKAQASTWAKYQMAEIQRDCAYMSRGPSDDRGNYDTRLAQSYFGRAGIAVSGNNENEITAAEDQDPDNDINALDPVKLQQAGIQFDGDPALYVPDWSMFGAASDALQSSVSNNATLPSLLSSGDGSEDPTANGKLYLFASSYLYNANNPPPAATPPPPATPAAPTLNLTDQQNDWIDALNTPVDHTLVQPGQQAVSGKEMTIADVDAQVQGLQSTLDSYGDMSQQSQLEIQMAQDRASKFYEMLSNIMKSVNDTQNDIVANLKSS